jgi:hypothetical protein
MNDVTFTRSTDIMTSLGHSRKDPEKSKSNFDRTGHWSDHKKIVTLYIFLL